ncbi:MAG: amidohydrolase [Bacteroidota bacterium]|nr:amidohydrolase [Bacteroidota bacterium]
MRILIKNILLDKEIVCVLIKDKKFEKIFKANAIDIQTNNTLILKEKEGKTDIYEYDEVLDGYNKALLPGFYNLHCHAAMNLLRGYAEDMPLFDWLQRIWQREAELKAEDIYNGTRLAIVEMIKSGTLFFADMYWHHKEVIRAVEEMGIRCDVGVSFMDRLGSKQIEENFDFIKQYNKDKHERISLSPAAHAIYTCSKDLYQKCYEISKECNTFLQTHLAETKQEYEDCKKNNDGYSPVEYLNNIGVLDKQSIVAHCVYFTEKDAEIFAKTNAVAVHNPCSNMKLASGVFPYSLLKKYNCNMALGTDGASSNNNLSMIEEMKMACLLGKVFSQRADSIRAKDVFDMATINGAKAYNLQAGAIEEGMLADCILVDLDNERMQPLYDVVYNLVYSADSSCIDTLICNGKILMKNHRVNNEEEIITIAKKYAKV